MLKCYQCDLNLALCLAFTRLLEIYTHFQTKTSQKPYSPGLEGRLGVVPHVRLFKTYTAVEGMDFKQYNRIK